MSVIRAKRQPALHGVGEAKAERLGRVPAIGAVEIVGNQAARYSRGDAIRPVMRPAGVVIGVDDGIAAGQRIVEGSAGRHIHVRIAERAPADGTIPGSPFGILQTWKPHVLDGIPDAERSLRLRGGFPFYAYTGIIYSIVQG